jgi:hypothetical protein
MSLQEKADCEVHWTMCSEERDSEVKVGWRHSEVKADFAYVTLVMMSSHYAQVTVHQNSSS